jgi:hypothetical protein
METNTKSQGPHPRIVVGLPNLQDQIRMVNRVSGTADEPDLGRWGDLGNLLSELYIQLQHQDRVTVHRFGTKNCSPANAVRQANKVQGQTSRRGRSSAAPQGLEPTPENKKVIQASLERWQVHNKFGRSLGRGLSRAELVDKVAGETGASKRHVRRSLSPEG